MSYHGKLSDRDCPFDSERGAPVGIRIQRTVSPERALDCPPPEIPESSAASSSSEDEKEMDSKTEVRVAVEKKTHHIPLQERTSYVEEPPSGATTLDRQELKKEKERALVRRITNEMQMAHFIQKVEMPRYAAVDTAFSHGSKPMGCGRLIEKYTRKLLWCFGKGMANHRTISGLIAFTFFLCIALLGPIFYHNNIYIGSPFPFVFGKDYAKDRNVGLRPITHFNYSNPQFKTIDFVNENSFAVLLRTRFPKDTILRRDAVLAYSTLKKKLEDFPAGHKELLEMCLFDCENEKEMVDKIIKKSSQVALTYPETFVSMTKDERNISRAYLGAAIGGVETDTDGAIDRAQALLMTFDLRDDVTPAQKQAWIENFNDQIEHTGASNVSIFSWSPVTSTNDMVGSMCSVVSVLPASAIIILFICLLATLGPNAYQTKPSVGFITALVLVLSCLGGSSVSLFFMKSVDPVVWPVFFIIAGEYSVYASRLSEISVEVDRSESQLETATESLEANIISINGASSNLTTALSGSNETVISYHIEEEDVLTAISSSFDLRTAQQMGLVTFVELNKENLFEEEDDVVTAKSVNEMSTFSAFRATMEPPSAVVTQKDDFSLRTAVSAGSVSWYSMPPSETDCQFPNMEEEQETRETVGEKLQCE